MKKSCLLIAMLMLVAAISATPVSKKTAYQVGTNFLSQKSQTKAPLSLQLVYEPNAVANDKVQDFVPYYVFSSENNGYVIVSGDDRFRPVLGYSLTESFGSTEMPINMQVWLNGYVEEMNYYIEHDVQPVAEISNQWKALILNTPYAAKADIIVEPLLSTKWDQISPYNNACPYDEEQGKRTVTGCTATAMAQVLKYWNYPIKGEGAYSYTTENYGVLSVNFADALYNWDKMPGSFKSTSPNDQKAEVAKLIYHCGVSADMNYAVDGSGASVLGKPSAEYALKNYFKYKSSLKGEYRYSTQESYWAEKVKAELNAKRPVLYAGYGKDYGSGHAFVCDGYDSEDFFHFNWGWSGSKDGYFALSALTPGSGGTGGGGYDFTYSQQALFGVEPREVELKKCDLRLYADITMPYDEIYFNEGFTANVKVANYEKTSALCVLGAEIFNEKGEFVEFMDIEPAVIGSQTYADVKFTSLGSRKLDMGTYDMVIYYKTAEDEWLPLNQGNYTNKIRFTIIEEPVCNVQNVPFAYDCEVRVDPCWLKVDNDADGLGWYQTTCARPGSTGTKVYASDSYSDGDAFRVEDWLVLPQILVPSTGATMTWWTAAKEVGRTQDVCEVRVSTIMNNKNLNVYSSIFEEEIGTDEWSKKSVDLSKYAGKKIFIAFIHKSNGKNVSGMLLDDISIFDPTSIADVNDNVRIYPNPTAGRFTIEGISGNDVSVYDMMGRMIQCQMDVVNQNTVVDLSQYASGIYTIRIKSDDGVMVKKVVKQ